VAQPAAQTRTRPPDDQVPTTDPADQSSVLLIIVGTLRPYSVCSGKGKHRIFQHVDDPDLKHDSSATHAEQRKRFGAIGRLRPRRRHVSERDALQAGPVPTAARGLQERALRSRSRSRGSDRRGGGASRGGRSATSSERNPYTREPAKTDTLPGRLSAVVTVGEVPSRGYCGGNITRFPSPTTACGGYRLTRRLTRDRLTSPRPIIRAAEGSGTAAKVIDTLSTP